MREIHAKKSLGQNFLIDHGALFDIATSLEIAGKHIIEVGPGYGALTDYLIRGNPLSLDLVELDKDMVNILQERYGKGGYLQKSRSFGEFGNSFDEVFEEIQEVSEVSGISENKSRKEFKMNQRKENLLISLHSQDILTFTPPYENYSVIANIPYYITSPILFRFLYELPHPPEAMIIMMQKEVGEKILEGRAKKPHHSLLSLAMEQACENIEIVRYVGKESFDPAPKVDSIVLKFEGKKQRDIKLEKALISLWKVALAHPRKTLLSNLKGTQFESERVKNWLLTCGYDERVRAEAIKKEDWNNFPNVSESSR